MIIIDTTMINTVYLDQYTIIDESSMINDDFGNFSKPICRFMNVSTDYFVNFILSECIEL